MPIPVKDANLNADYAAPAVGAAAVTPNDSTDLAISPARALYIGGAGNISVDTAAGDTVTFSGVTAGMVLVAVGGLAADGGSISPPARCAIALPRVSRNSNWRRGLSSCPATPASASWRC